ncbi:shikimate dehydrogenase [Oxobacter pfennigii]|uniref:Shikimate dehydrogenase (NADP(+)) n=1 Tax=Oxobacter pfennigii TaxID=36849 RepID=A0A0P8X2A0_9CLOT|nr:shikimate dehydrogenase [Oxobacter pfennigii]KPU44941.1 shikimate dehydrogenase [Oxobacter pfennigii]
MNDKTSIFGLLGYPLGHSLSPKIHNGIYSLYDINAMYKLFPVQEDMLNDAVKAIKVLNISGSNVTIPYKQKIMQYLDFISDEALSIGAVNTVKNENGILKGYNTDYSGFKKSLDYNRVDINEKDVFVLGAGGAARSIVQCLLNNKAQIHIFGRTADRASVFIGSLKDTPSEILPCGFDELNEKIKFMNPHMIVNCTPLGMKGFEGSIPITSKDIKGNVNVLYDLIYNPIMTDFLKMGEESGCKIIGGMDMLLLQALDAIEIWTGKSFDFYSIKEFAEQEGIITNL